MNELSKATIIAAIIVSVWSLIAGGLAYKQGYEMKQMAQRHVAETGHRIDTLEDKQQELSQYCNFYIQEWRNMNGYPEDDFMPDSGNDFSDEPYVDTTYPFDNYPSGRVNDGSSGKYLGVPPEVVQELSE